MAHQADNPRRVPKTAAADRRLRAHKPRQGFRRAILAAALVMGAVSGVVLSRIVLWNFHLKRFAVVHEGVLYRSAQPTQRGFEVLVDHYGARTIACLRRDNSALRRNLLDQGEPNGADEDAAIAQLGARHLQWPMGGEAYWPWFGPEQFEAFFELMDEPANFPVSVHCIGGRHRTGTFVALYRMEYERWSAENALREMYAFDFGSPVPIQDHCLRTYLPRPLPSRAEWAVLQATFAELLDRPDDYATLIRRLRLGRKRSEIEEAVEGHLRARRPFALSLAHRLIDQPNDRLTMLACAQASDCLRQSDATPVDWAISASLVADFGDPRQQQQLLDLVTSEPRRDTPSPRYQAVVRGVTNRYSVNRIPYLRPLLDDQRTRPEPEAAHQPGTEQPYRYCDTAVSRLATIADRCGVMGAPLWDDCRRRFLQWFAAHPQACRLGRMGEVRLELSEGPAPAIEDRDDYR